MNVVITGSAGYLGSRLMKRFKGAERIDVKDGWRLGNTTPNKTPDLVIHCAGFIQARESVEKPTLYWNMNVIDAYRFFAYIAPSTRVILASSAGVYGNTPYGHTKTALELMLKDFGFPLVVFRYFNIAGGGERHDPETHLIPRALMAAKTRKPLTVYGGGVARRDYIHVDDVVRLNVLAANSKATGTFDVGTGVSHSVLDVLACVKRVTGRVVRVKHANAVDEPHELVASKSSGIRLRAAFGWKQRHDLESIIESEWRTMR